MSTKIITILIAGTVFTAGLMVGFGGYVFAAENYNSSKSNTATGIINRDVGNLLIDYGYGGEVINQVTEALARGTTKDDLRAILGATSARSPAVVEEVLRKLEVELKRLGIKEDDTQAVSQPGVGQIEKEISTPGATGAVPRAAGDPVDSIDISLDEIPAKRAEPAPATTPQQPSAGTGEQRSLVPAVQKVREAAQTMRQDLRENAKDLRANFRENVKTTIGHVDHGKTGRIAVAHGKGLRMLNRFRSAIARFDHILGRLESRIEKIRIEGEEQARAKGKVTWTNPPEMIALIEEAKNMSVENEAKLAELEAKYESLLTGENPGGIAEEARAIAKELKSEIEKLHGLLDDIKKASVDYNSSRPNVKL